MNCLHFSFVSDCCAGRSRERTADRLDDIFFIMHIFFFVHKFSLIHVLKCIRRFLRCRVLCLKIC